MTFKRLPNGKWKYVKTVARGKVDPDDPSYGIRLKGQMKKINPFCNECGATYNLADPCEHHLSDSPEHRMKFKSIKQKKKKQQEDINTKQKRFI